MEASGGDQGEEIEIGVLISLGISPSKSPGVAVVSATPSLHPLASGWSGPLCDPPQPAALTPVVPLRAIQAFAVPPLDSLDTAFAVSWPRPAFAAEHSS